MRLSICPSTSSLKPSTQNKSNRQSMHVKLCSISLVSLAAARNLAKNSMHTFMQLKKLCIVTCKLLLHWSCDDTDASVALFSLEGSMLPRLLYSCAWTQATCRTRETAHKALKEAIVLSGESCKMRTKLLTRTHAISGLQAQCSSASNKQDNSLCNRNEK